MFMPKGFNIDANGLQVEVRYGGAAGDFISLTDIAKYRTAENPGYVIQNWMRTRNTVRFLGLWEHFHNPEFNYLEFEAIEREAGYFFSLSTSVSRTSSQDEVASNEIPGRKSLVPSSSFSL